VRKILVPMCFVRQASYRAIIGNSHSATFSKVNVERSDKTHHRLMISRVTSRNARTPPPFCKGGPGGIFYPVQGGLLSRANLQKSSLTPFFDGLRIALCERGGLVRRENALHRVKRPLGGFQAHCNGHLHKLPDTHNGDISPGELNRRRDCQSFVIHSIDPDLRSGHTGVLDSYRTQHSAPSTHPPKVLKAPEVALPHQTTPGTGA
jgi:hypothetical protein